LVQAALLEEEVVGGVDAGGEVLLDRVLVDEALADEGVSKGNELVEVLVGEDQLIIIVVVLINSYWGYVTSRE